MNFDEGELLLFDKPKTWTSFDVVNKIRYAIKCKKVGHAGTLDPLATGLLILCTGKMTKQIDTYQAQEKEYLATIQFGKTTPSADLETDFDAEYPYFHITQEDLQNTINQHFIGQIEQIPPIYSAIKQDGKRLYELARKGKTTEIKPRTVTINEIEITRFELPFVEIKIVCSKGTYIRSIAQDLGKAMDSGGVLADLIRTRSGDFLLQNAWQLTDFLEHLKTEHQAKEHTDNAGF